VSSASILCRRLKRERGIVRRRVTLSLRSAEILPWFYDPPNPTLWMRDQSSRNFGDFEKEKKNFPSLKCGYEGGERADHESRVSSPYATAGKLARLQCFPCRDLEKKKSSKSPNVATRGRKGAKHRSTRTRRSRRTASHGFFFSPMSTYTPPPPRVLRGRRGPTNHDSRP